MSLQIMLAKRIYSLLPMLSTRVEEITMKSHRNEADDGIQQSEPNEDIGKSYTCRGGSID